MVVLSAAFFRVYYWSWTAFNDEAIQRRLWPIASRIAEELKPHLSPIVDETELTRTARTFLVPNPSINIYLLDESGKIVNSFCNTYCLALGKTIPLSSFQNGVKQLDQGEGFPAYGPDPEIDHRMSVFSAATLSLPDKRFFVYTTLLSSTTQGWNYKDLAPVALRATMLAILLITVTLMLLGQYLISRTFAPFRQIMQTVEKLRTRDYTTRAPSTFVGELKDLSLAINGMADQISLHVSEIEEKDRMRMELISNIWHDIRAPLTGISALAQLLESEKSSPTVDRDSIVKSLVANTSLLGRIVSDLQELGQLEVGDLKPKRVRTSLIRLADEIALIYGGRTAEKGIDLQLDFPDHIAPIDVDPGMMARVMSNLLENSLRYTKVGGFIRLRISETPHDVMFSIEDNGTGIAESDLPHIFDREFQSKQETGAKHGMSGLGLAIVKKIIEQHGGTIGVTSVRDTSTTFEIRLPKSIEMS